MRKESFKIKMVIPKRGNMFSRDVCEIEKILESVIHAHFNFNDCAIDVENYCDPWDEEEEK